MRMRLHFLLLLRKEMKYDKDIDSFSGSKVNLHQRYGDVSQTPNGIIEEWGKQK